MVVASDGRSSLKRTTQWRKGGVAAKTKEKGEERERFWNLREAWPLWCAKNSFAASRTFQTTNCSFLQRSGLCLSFFLLCNNSNNSPPQQTMPIKADYTFKLAVVGTAALERRPL
jgi:hypothetical protein